MSGQVEVRKHSCRQDRDGQWIVSFQFHPDDIYNDLVLAKKDTVFNLTYELAESEEARDANPEQAGAAVLPKPAPSAILKDMGKSLVRRAAMLCRDEQFQKWSDTYIPEAAAEYVKYYCEIQSRSELATNHEAQRRFLELEQQYRAETGQMEQP